MDVANRLRKERVSDKETLVILSPFKPDRNGAIDMQDNRFFSLIHKAESPPRESLVCESDRLKRIGHFEDGLPSRMIARRERDNVNAIRSNQAYASDDHLSVPGHVDVIAHS